MAGSGIEPSVKPSAADDWLTPGRFALLLGLLILATFPGVLLGGATFIIRDFGMFSYPVAFFHRQCFWQGELPLWNPLSHCGVPFLAQWNTLTLYPLSLIYLLLPLTWSLSFFCLAHLFWGGLGMYFLAHRWTHHRLAAGLAGLIFSFNGLTLNFLMWPSHIATFGWLPWVVWLGQRAWREGGTALVWATVAGAMQMLAGGPETIAATWLILLVLAGRDWVREAGLRSRLRTPDPPAGMGAEKESDVNPLTPSLSPSEGERVPFRAGEGDSAGSPDFHGSGCLRLVARFLGMGILVALICAVQLLPFLELLAHSQRNTGFGSSEWSMPLWGWANFLVPLFRAYPTAQGLFLQIEQNWTSSYYAGIGTVLFVAVAVRRVRDWRVVLLAVLLFLSLVLALGDRGLLFRALRFCVPVVGFARYPIKFVILTLALAPLLAAFGLQALTRKAPRIGRFEWACGLAILLLIGMIVALGGKGRVPEFLWRLTWQNGLARAGLFVLILFLTGALLNSLGRRRILFGCLLLVAFWLDFATHVPTQNPTVRPGVYSPGWGNAHREWDSQPKLGQSRAMLSPAVEEVIRLHQLPNLEENCLVSRLALFANCNLLDELPQVYGFFSLAPGEANDATCLPYVHTNSDFAVLLDFMGVSQITAPGTICKWAARPTAMPIVTAGQKPVFADDQTVINAFAQTNIDLRSIVFLPPEARGGITATQRTAAHVLATKFANQRVSIQTEAPAASLVVIAQAYYPAWKAYVDDRPAQIWRANYAFQTVQVPAGRHQIQLRYEDKPLLIGAALSGLGLLTCLCLWLLARFQRGSAQRN